MQNEYQRMSMISQRAVRALCVHSAYSLHNETDHMTICITSTDRLLACI